MKKILITLLVAIAAWTGATAADNIDKEIVLGMNVASYNGPSFSSRIGFHAGVRFTLGLPRVTQGLYVNAAAMLSLRGGSADSVTFNPFYLDIPVHLGYRYAINNGVAIFGEAGPYVGVGLFGTTYGKSMFSDEVGLRRFDMGLGLRAGVEFRRKLVTSMGYDFGLTNVASEEGIKLKNHNYYISLGYKF
ncbi:MAG: porin family protein [Muribaculaceae bacterium]|nr:porin family protein [Muribaculaceae bacterium]MBR1474075.1 porin family protein [Muribaculaceae bacterium]